MPAVFLDRLPLPSLKTYTLFSILALVVAVYYGHSVATEVNEDEQQPPEFFLSDDFQGEFPVTLNFLKKSGFDPEVILNDYCKRFIAGLLQEVACVLAVINIFYCVGAIFAKCLQKVFFGELRVVEIQHIKDKFWNFVFYKFIFVFGVLNVQAFEEVFLWTCWFSVLGALHLITQLGKDRFDFLSSSPTTTPWVHGRLLAVLVEVLLCGVGLLSFSIALGLTGFSVHILFFLIAECLIVLVRTMYVITRLVIHLWDVTHEGIWENRAKYVYYSELITELLISCIDFAHHFHMLFWSNMFLSMASLVICMQMRHIATEFQRRIKRHKNYLRVVNTLQSRFPMATNEELEINSDRCAICWEKLESARKLPCGHYFHNSCLLSWLEQDTTCPTCRTALGQNSQGQEPAAAAAGNQPNQAGPQTPGRQPHMVNHFFHFDGSRYVSWLPSFSVEVMTHAHGHGNRRNVLSLNSQLDNIAREIANIFPQVPLDVIVEDLRHTHSMDGTIDNIVENRIRIPEPVAGSEQESREPSAAMEQGAVGGGEEEPLLYDLPPVQETGQPGSRDDMERSRQDRHGLGGSWEDLGAESIPANVPAPVDNTVSTASRFSKSSSERETILEQRKRSLLERAKKNYIHRQETDSEQQSSSVLTPQEPAAATSAVTSPSDASLRWRPSQL